MLFSKNQKSVNSTQQIGFVKLSTVFVEVAEDMAGVVFEDIFDVKDIDPGGKKFDRGI